MRILLGHLSPRSCIVLLDIVKVSVNQLNMSALFILEWCVCDIAIRHLYLQCVIKFSGIKADVSESDNA